MELPNNINIPFFSYGLFRPGEIAFQVIEKYVDLNRIEIKRIKGLLKLRDGLLIFDENGNDEVQGYQLYFKGGMELSAYEAIRLLEPDKYYKWNDSQSKFYGEFNLLVGRYVNKGVDEEKGENDPLIWDKLFDSIWSDPFIINGFNLLEDYSKKKIPIQTVNKDFEWHDESCFNDYLSYQMFYLFLCSILERLMFLNGGFGAPPNKQLILFSKDKTLKKVFNRLINAQEFPQFKKSFKREVYRSDNPSDSVKWNFEPAQEVNMKKVMEYYYGLRSNIAHRGKSGVGKYIALRESFEELKFILKAFWVEKEIDSKKVKVEIDNIIKSRNG
jgi:hypothetical protein